MRAETWACVLAFVTLASAPAVAQQPKSAPLAQQLVAALKAGNLDSIAAKDPAGSDTYIGALHINGVQLLVVSGSYSAPALLDARIAGKQYRDVYLDLNGASPIASRTFIEDLGADGLKADREDNQPFDSVTIGGKLTNFDGDWRKQKLSEDEYTKTYGTADEGYARMLTALLEQLKKGS